MNTDKNNTQLPQSSVKSRFFAQYWGQKICEYNFNKEKLDFVKVETLLNSDEKTDNWSLFLKPLSKITDVNLNYCHYILFCDNKKFTKYQDEDGYINWQPQDKYELEQLKLAVIGSVSDVTELNYDIYTISHLSEYLRSNGYAVPFMEYSVDDLVSFGWVQLL